MASVMEKDDSVLNNWGPKWERKEHKKLRYSGQEYVSKSGKVVPAKKQPELVCTCPQKCGEKIPLAARERLFKEFYHLSDHAMQNRFLQAHIEIRAVQRRFWRQQERTASGRIQRRVSCKYQVPLLTSPDDVSDQGEVRPGVKIVEVCQKAFMNIYAITEKRVRIQRERLICHAQEAANSPSPGPRDDVPLLGSPQMRGGDNLYPYGVPRDIFAAAAPLSTLSNLSITPSRVASVANDTLFSKMFNRNDILATLGDRDVTMVPAHNSSLSIIPVKGVDAHQNSAPAAFPVSTAKIPRDVSMIPVKDATDSGEQCMPTDLSMPKAGAKAKSPSPEPHFKIHPTTTIEQISNQPVDLTVKPKPKIEISENKAKASAKEELKSGFEHRPSVIFPKESALSDLEMKTLNDLAMRRFGAGLAKLEEARHLPLPVPIPTNGYDLALVNSFFQNQLWQPEYIDVDHLRGYQRKLEETTEMPKERKRRPRKAVRITPTEIVQCEKVTSMEVADEVPNSAASDELDDNKCETSSEGAKLSPNYVPNNCDEPKDLSESVDDADEDL